MDSLHHGEAAAGMLKAKLLVVSAAVAATIKLLQSESITAYLTIRNFTLRIPEFLDDWLYSEWAFSRIGAPAIRGTSLKDLTLRPELDLPMVGAGGLMGIRTGVSLMIGAIINYAVLAPIMIERGDIVPHPVKGTIGFREITFWSLWCGVAMMTAASLLAFFGKPKQLVAAFGKLSGGGGPGGARERTDVLAHIELPLKVSLVGVPLIGVLVALMAKSFFGIEYWLSVVALALVLVFCLIAINSTALTSITPIGAMGKLTQLTFGALAPGNKEVNLMTAGITGEVASHSANLLQDIKPGYMLGAKPRQQAIGHILGIFAGAVLSIPVFYLVFLKLPPSDLVATELSMPYAMDEKYAMPAAITWKAVADVLAEGIHMIKPSARYAALAGILIGVTLEIWRMLTKNRFPLSAVAIGLGLIIHFHTCLSMFTGSFLFWAAEKLFSSKESRVNQTIVQNQEPICAGLIAGGALMGIAVAVADLFLPQAPH
jgi:uncharacterized oligopeptide transporter (OPT) family protein